MKKILIGVAGIVILIAVAIAELCNQRATDCSGRNTVQRKKMLLTNINVDIPTPKKKH